MYSLRHVGSRFQSLDRRDLLRFILFGALLAVALLLLGMEIILLLPRIAEFSPTDYNVMLGWGQAAQNGNLYSYYPLPALLFIFLPLSLLPNWFVFVWTALPFLMILYLFPHRGLGLWLYVPTLVQAAWGQLDGFLILPLYWLFTAHSLLAPVSAALITLKPQFALFIVPFQLLEWARQRQWRALRLFGIIMAFLYIPSFIVDPLWPLHWVSAMRDRADLWLLPQRGSSLWGWVWHGGWTVFALPIVAGLALLLFFRAWRCPTNRLRALHLLTLLTQPVLLVVSLVTVIPAIKSSSRQLVALVILSWLAYAFDWLVGGWGGVYVILPILALWFLAQERSAIQANAHAPR